MARASESAEHGRISLRAIVLPLHTLDGERSASPGEDIDDEATWGVSTSKSSPLASYLEVPRGGKQHIVFVVNGQRQESLDNSFIVQQLGFKYLRNRMMVVVEADGLSEEAVARLMQGSRQGFYRGEIWEAIVQRIVATLKGDPDLNRLEEEAAEAVSQLQAGDEAVRQALDQLIESHSEFAQRPRGGEGFSGGADGDPSAGAAALNRGDTVSLKSRATGFEADYPVLTAPGVRSIQLQPGILREVEIHSQPRDSWPNLREVSVVGDPLVPELEVTFERFPESVVLRLLFKEQVDFDPNEYPLAASIRALARFEGASELRELELPVQINTDFAPPDPELSDAPTWLRCVSRQPVRIRAGSTATHVAFRWDGSDDLASVWRFDATILDERGEEWRDLTFSTPRRGKFSLLVRPDGAWDVGQELAGEVTATGPSGETLKAAFEAVVVESKTPEPPEPRLNRSRAVSGSVRRPPYELKYITREQYSAGDCWGQPWTDDDAACFEPPTTNAPLTLIINQDWNTLEVYRSFVIKKYTEGEVERRMNKYASHVGYHLYQMYLANDGTRGGQEPSTGDGDRDELMRHEVQRVANTLIKLMEVSR